MIFLWKCAQVRSRLEPFGSAGVVTLQSIAEALLASTLLLALFTIAENVLRGFPPLCRFSRQSGS